MINAKSKDNNQGAAQPEAVAKAKRGVKAVVPGPGTQPQASELCVSRM